MLREVARWGAIGTIAGLATACLPGVAAAADGAGPHRRDPGRHGQPAGRQPAAGVGALARWRARHGDVGVAALRRLHARLLRRDPRRERDDVRPGRRRRAGRCCGVKLSVSNAKGWAWAVTPPTQAVAAAPGPVVVAAAPAGAARARCRRGPWCASAAGSRRAGLRVTALTVRAPRRSAHHRPLPRRTLPAGALGPHRVARPPHARSSAGCARATRLDRHRHPARLRRQVDRAGDPPRRRRPARVDRCLYPDAPKVRACPSS